MSIGKAVRDLIEARGLRPAEVADRLGGKRNRATFYRLLSGETTDPRVSTLLEICNSLTTSPSELLQLAGLVSYQGRSLDLIDVELRQVFGELQDLNEDDKRLCLVMARGVIDLRAKRNISRSRRRASRVLQKHEARDEAEAEAREHAEAEARGKADAKEQAEVRAEA